MKSIAHWNGAAWSALGAGLPNEVNGLAVFDDAGASPSLFAGGAFSNPGPPAIQDLARWSCGASISLSLAQPGPPGSPVWVENANLSPGRDYYNVFSLEPCASGPGTGPWLGLCALDPTFLISQLFLPVGTEPFHFEAPSSYALFGPYFVPPITIEAVCFELNGLAIGPVSSVASLAIH